jgi:hypothetical protein
MIPWQKCIFHSCRPISSRVVVESNLHQDPDRDNTYMYLYTVMAYDAGTEA